MKNLEFVWSGQFNGGTTFSIRSVLVINNELVVDYLDVDELNPESNCGFMDSILITEKNSVVDLVRDYEYDIAFAPNELNGKLSFFAEIDNEYFFVKLWQKYQT